MLQKIYDLLLEVDWSMVIGLIALAFTAIALWVQRKHNHLSVKPIAIVSVADYVNRLAVTLHNKGSGPLIIKSLSFTRGDGRVEKSLIAFFDSSFDAVVWSTFKADIDGWAILPGGNETLIELVGDPTDGRFVRIRDQVRKVLSAIEVAVHYQDVYENDLPPKTRPLNFFAR